MSGTLESTVQGEKIDKTFYPAVRNQSKMEISMSLTRGGGRKPFKWQFVEDNIQIKKRNGRKIVYSLSETYEIIGWLESQFEREWFPLANNLDLMGRGEERDGLGMAILRFRPGNLTYAQGSSYLGVILEEVGVFKWNLARKGIKWCIVDRPESLDQFREMIIKRGKGMPSENPGFEEPLVSFSRP